MKRAIFAAAMAALSLASCEKQMQEVSSAETLCPEVKVTFAASDTRGFFDPSASAETWEKQLSSVKVLVYNPSGELAVSRQFTSSEVSARSAVFALPKSLAEKTCTFAVVANRDTDDCATLTDLRALSESSASSYNSTFPTVSTSSARSQGFVLSGETSAAVAAVGSSTAVAVALKRTVAKVAVRIAPTDAFMDRYYGTLTVNSVKVSQAASRSAIMASGAQNTGTMNFTHIQTPVSGGGYSQALFYLYSSPAAAAGSRVKLEAECTYDADGDPSTTSDTMDVTYSAELSGSGTGAIERNGYYRVTLSLNGLTGEQCTASVTVSDWETPVSQDVELGI